MRIRIGGKRYRLHGSRILALAVATSVWLALPALLGANAGSGDGARPAAQVAPGARVAVHGASGPDSVVVQSGDTLWGLAVRFAPASEDLRAWIAETVRLNRLQSSLINPGQRLLLPAGSR